MSAFNTPTYMRDTFFIGYSSTELNLCVGNNDEVFPELLLEKMEIEDDRSVVTGLLDAEEERDSCNSVDGFELYSFEDLNITGEAVPCGHNLFQARKQDLQRNRVFDSFLDELFGYVDIPPGFEFLKDDFNSVTVVEPENDLFEESTKSLQPGEEKWCVEASSYSFFEFDGTASQIPTRTYWLYSRSTVWSESFSMNCSTNSGDYENEVN